MAHISLDSGRTCHDAHEAIGKIAAGNLWGEVVAAMDKSILASARRSVAPCTQETLLAQYLDASRFDLIIDGEPEKAKALNVYYGDTALYAAVDDLSRDLYLKSYYLDENAVYNLFARALDADGDLLPNPAADLFFSPSSDTDRLNQRAEAIAYALDELVRRKWYGTMSRVQAQALHEVLYSGGSLAVYGVEIDVNHIERDWLKYHPEAICLYD